MAPPYPGGHNLNKPELTLPDAASTQVLTFLAKCFLRWKMFHDFIFLFLCNNSPPHCGLTLPQAIYIEQTLIYTTWVCFTQVSAFLAKSFLRRRFLKSVFYLFPCEKLNPNWVLSNIRRSWFEQIWINTTWECFHTNVSLSGQMAFENKIFENIYLSRGYNSTPILVPSLNPYIMM